MYARVIRDFFHTNTGRFWHKGETFRGDSQSARQLAARGFLRLPGADALAVGLVDVPPAEAPDLNTLTVAELKSLAAKRGLTVPKKARKADLIDMLRE